MDLDSLRPKIVTAFPEFARSSFTLMQTGWDCLAVDVDDRFILKVPRHAAAERRLVREARLLEVVRPVVSISVPALQLHHGSPPLSRHEKIQGEHLLPAQYERLTGTARDRLAGDLALFYAQLHALDVRSIDAAVATPIEPWLTADEILARALPRLPPVVRSHAEQVVRAWQQLPPDPLGTTYGFFDGHGWNMAFDHATKRLNGIYDFGDSGYGPLHQDFIYAGLTSADLASRIAGAYETLRGVQLDRERIHVLGGVLRLSELAEYADDPRHAPAMVRNAVDWVERR